MKKLIALTVLFGTSQLALAESAHQHGVAALNIAIEGHDLEIELHTPADNLIGFEHAPKTEAQAHKLEDTIAQLKKPASLIAINTTAKCSLEKAHVESPFEDEHGDKHHDDHAKEHHKDEHDEKHGHKEKHDDDHKHGHKEKDHDEHHKEHAHDDHHDEHNHDKHDESAHSDFEIHYEYHCDNIKQLSSIDLKNLFKQYPAFEKINANWISSNSQSAVVLNNKETQVNLKP